MLMKNKGTASIAGALLTVTLFAGSALAQVPDQPQPRPEQGQPQAQESTARGELQSVDATAKTLTIKPTEGADQRFTYTDNTRVTGGKGVAGLATMSGRQVIVRFTMQGATRVATDIELQPEK